MKSKSASKIWIIMYIVFVFIAFGIIGSWVIHIDPFFHFHKPLVDGYSYTLNNERSQNDGISKHFDYDALITGTSMTQNFKTSEMDEIFGTHSIKVPYSGGTFKEINDNVVNAIEHNENLRYVVRSLDMWNFTEDKDAMRQDLGKYPTYLYDDNVFNDVNYVFNRNVIFDRVYPMTTANDQEGFTPGITSFDSYSNWMSSYTFGIKTVCPDGVPEVAAGEPVHLTETEKEMVLGSTRQNITDAAEKYPEVTFYYFITPYSAVWWKDLINAGTIYKQTEAERLIIEELIKYDNIKLFSFNTQAYITADINNYKDSHHYGQWVNSLILRYMHDGKCQLTKDNYESYLDEELKFYLLFDYNILNSQVDYENDYYSAALLNEEINGVKPLSLEYDDLEGALFNKAELSTDEEGNPMVTCTGSLQRELGGEISLDKYMKETEYIGFEITLDVTDYDYLVFYGQKLSDHGQPTVYIYDEVGLKGAECTKSYHDLDGKKHQYLINVSSLSGNVRIIFNGGYVDDSGSADSKYVFSDITLY